MLAFGGGGDNPPIRVTSPNDPRLLRYRDSLSVYNYGKESGKDLLSMKEKDNEMDFIRRDRDRYPVAAFDRLASYNGTYPDPVDSVSKQLGFVRDRPFNDKNRDIGAENWVPNMMDQPLFKKPVQPYYYAPDKPPPPKLKRTNTGGLASTGDRGEIATPALSSSVVARQQKTPFSYSGMDRSDGQQKSVYFPDLQSWKDFTGAQGAALRDTMITNNDKEAHATGYFKYGGDMKKMIRRKKLFAGGNPDQDTSGMDAYSGSGVPTFDPTGDMTSGFNWGPSSASAGAPAGGSTATGGSAWSKVFGSAGQILPYASNISNSFRRPPMPFQPTMVNPQPLSPVNLSNARNQIVRSVRAQDLNADRALNSQAAVAARSANLAKEMEGTSQVSEQEAFLNSRQKAESAGMNLNVDTMNATAMNRYRESLVERSMAEQREQSGNLANASDKMIGQINEQRKASLDLQKMNTLSQMWKESGVYDRMLAKMKGQGNNDPTGILAQLNDTHAYGGRVRRKAFASGGSVPYTHGTDLAFEDWYRNSTPEGLAGQDLSTTDKDYYSMYKSGRSSSYRRPMSIVGADPMSVRRPSMHPSYMDTGGVIGGTPAITQANVNASNASGREDITTMDQINRILTGQVKGLPRFGDSRDQLGTEAYIFRQQNGNAGLPADQIIHNFYGRPNTGSPVDMMRAKYNTIGYGPNAVYNSAPAGGYNRTPVSGLVASRAFGGFVSGSTKPFAMRRGRATGEGYINPFGGSQKGKFNLGAGIPNGAFSPRSAAVKGAKLSGFADGGLTTDFPMDTPDDMMTNDHDARIPGAYSVGGVIGKPGYMDYPVRPKGIRRMDFAGIEHMAAGGWPMGRQPGPFEEDNINGPRPKPGPDDVTIGMDILKKGGWIRKAVNPAHKGFCSPVTKSTCTPRRKAFAMTMKKHHGFH